MTIRKIRPADNMCGTRAYDYAVKTLYPHAQRTDRYLPGKREYVQVGGRIYEIVWQGKRVFYREA